MKRLGASFLRCTMASKSARARRCVVSMRMETSNEELGYGIGIETIERQDDGWYRSG